MIDHTFVARIDGMMYRDPYTILLRLIKDAMRPQRRRPASVRWYKVLNPASDQMEGLQDPPVVVECVNGIVTVVYSYNSAGLAFIPAVLYLLSSQSATCNKKTIRARATVCTFFGTVCKTALPSIGTWERNHVTGHINRTDDY